MSEILTVIAKPVEYLGPRRIYIRSRRGETYWSVEEATELLIQLTSAIERAIDPTPLPKPIIEHSLPRVTPPSRPSRDIGDLL